MGERGVWRGREAMGRRWIGAYVVCVCVSLGSEEVTRWGDVRACGAEYRAPGRKGLA